MLARPSRVNLRHAKGLWRVMAAFLLHEADKFQYGGLKSTLAQHMSMGANQYPWSVKESINILNRCNKMTQTQ